MGDIYIPLNIINDQEPERHLEMRFLVDTGATRAWIPENIAEELLIEPVGRVPLELADGNISEYPYGLCKFEYEGEIVNGTVVIGPKDIEPIAGTHLLQDFRLIVDLAHHTIKRGRAMRAKYCRLAHPNVPGCALK
ncbi:MAG: hypothetical protein HQ591_10740 [candidate division Zixibacteria bacterium]|nr:hypothetical protein [Candidatus Tariuqbacter arcticus]